MLKRKISKKLIMSTSLAYLKGINCDITNPEVDIIQASGFVVYCRFFCLSFMLSFRAQPLQLLHLLL